MKPLLVLARIVFVGCLWSIIFTEGIRVIMLENWRFDIFWPLHWVYAWNLWSSGWVIDTPKEWAFILIIISFIPLWLTGWIALSMVAWEKLAYKLITFPINLIKGKKVVLKPVANKTPVVVKKKSYKEIRPTGHRSPIRDYNDAEKPATPTTSRMPTLPKAANTPYIPKAPSSMGGLKDKVVNARETFSHSLFNLDNEDDDFDLDFDAFEKSDIFKIDDKKSKRKPETRNERNSRSFEDEESDDSLFHNALAKKPKKRFDDDDYPQHQREGKKDKSSRYEDKKNNKREDREQRDNRKDYASDNKVSRNEQKDVQTSEKQKSNNPIVEVLTQKGYDIITGITIKNTTIDFIAVSDSTICLCLVDKETGDWLADEERFNNEEPLWFSENSHRISPVRKVSLAKEALLMKLEEAEFDLDVKPYVIVQMGNIINAEDMFDIWDETNVEVTRINRGSPKEIKLFSKTVEEADGKLDREEFNALKKLLRGG